MTVIAYRCSTPHSFRFSCKNEKAENEGHEETLRFILSIVGTLLQREGACQSVVLLILSFQLAP
ncbi:hypothetical protein NITLEN_10972 [Nitrospira lenta]|uniref:Uncharacterized protein n=1 Tax=Nitrospira lenta TaxID=1436998 RepID=A0A330LAA6_9BACT|nr:hypothetical protein NITLEN_10972 [Nitrospira lenta]